MQKVNVNEASKHTTLADIAAATGYSIYTVHCAVTGKSNNQSAEKIREVAREMNYDPSKSRIRRDWNIANLDEIPVPATPPASFAELGKLIGINGTHACAYYHGRNTTPESTAYVRAAAERFGYVPSKPGYYKRNGATAKDIAERTGYAVQTVRNALGNTPCTLAKSTIQKIKKAAAEMNYDPTGYQPPCTGGRNLHAFLQFSNFPSPEVEKERMEILRKQGYSNAEIAKKIGKSYIHVHMTLGTQPGAITKASHTAATAKRYLRARQRERYQLEEAVQEYNQIKTQLEQIEAQKVSLSARMKELAPQFRRAKALDKAIAKK